ncbi:MAG: hypothetical protein GF364_08205 [Candidatus Lokiarchaeota archaeon]|nr:hypothetical protein [Candidatus Lokiarchaeota archaeon]
MSKFFNLYRRKGTDETIGILSNYGTKGIKQTEFFQILKEKHKHLNSFFRVRNELIDFKIISYILDEDNDKCLVLTEKGLEINKLLNQINDYFQLKNQ